jgi:hypothetical protein
VLRIVDAQEAALAGARGDFDSIAIAERCE